MVETNFAAAVKAGGEQNAFERKDGTFAASCSCLDRWEAEGGAITKKTTDTTR